MPALAPMPAIATLRALRLDEEIGLPVSWLASIRFFASFTASAPAVAAVITPSTLATVLAEGMGAERTDGPSARSIPVRCAPMDDVDSINLALLVLRCGLGAVMLAHGINHIFGGGKIAGTGRWFQSLGRSQRRLRIKVRFERQVVTEAPFVR